MTNEFPPLVAPVQGAYAECRNCHFNLMATNHGEGRVLSDGGSGLRVILADGSIGRVEGTVMCLACQTEHGAKVESRGSS
jgi:hypothetical protein